LVKPTRNDVVKIFFKGLLSCIHCTSSSLLIGQTNPSFLVAEPSQMMSTVRIRLIVIMAIETATIPLIYK